MRKFLIGVLAFYCSIVGAHAAQDIQGSPRPALWRSSFTCAVENLVLMASGSIHAHAVLVTSPAVNTSSYYSLFNGTSPATALSNFNITTATLMSTNINTSNSTSLFYPFDIYFPSGVVVNKNVVNSCVELFWDYVVPRYSNVVPWAP